MCFYGGCNSLTCERCRPKLVMCPRCKIKIPMALEVCPQCKQPVPEEDKAEARHAWFVEHKARQEEKAAAARAKKECPSVSSRQEPEITYSAEGKKIKTYSRY